MGWSRKKYERRKEEEIPKEIKQFKKANARK